MNVAEFAKKIKDKYPEYADIDDLTLAKRVVEKHPVYKDSVEFAPEVEAPAPTRPMQAAIPLAPQTTMAQPAPTGPAPGSAAISQQIRNVGRAMFDPSGLKDMAQLGRAARLKGSGVDISPEEQKALEDFTTENFKGIVLYPAAITGAAQAVGWYIANRTMPGAIRSAREAIARGLREQGVPSQEATRMADEGLSAAAARATAKGKEPGIKEFVKVRKAAEKGFGPKGKKAVVPAEAAPTEPVAQPALHQPSAPAGGPPIVSPKTATGSTLPPERQAEFMKTQAEVIKNVVKRGDITEAEIPSLVLDKAKDGVTLRAIVERRLKEDPATAVERATDEYHGFLQGIKKTAEAQPQVAQPPAAQTPAAPPMAQPIATQPPVPPVSEAPLIPVPAAPAPVQAPPMRSVPSPEITVPGGPLAERAKPTVDSVLSELSAPVSEKIGRVEIPVGLSVKKVGSAPEPKALPNEPEPPKPYKLQDQEAEKRWQAAHGLARKTFGESFKEAVETFKRQSTREFEYLPRGGEHVELRKNLLELQKYKGVAADKAIRLEHAVTFDLSKGQYETFEKAILLRDLKQEALKDRPLPFGLNKNSLDKELQNIEVAIAKDPQIQAAIEKRSKMFEGVNNSYAQAMSDIGFDVSERLTNKDYFHHQVLEYANAKAAGIQGAGGKVKTPTGRGFLKKREGSELDINTDYFQAETEVIAQQIHDIKVAKIIKFVDDKYNVSVKVDEIPPGYVEWRPREGNTFYMASSIPEKIAAQIADGTLKEISPDQIKKIMVMGGLRKAYWIPEEVAKTLDDLGGKKLPSSLSDKSLVAWKVYQLISPVRFIKYNARNVTGDLDAAFTFSPSSIKKVPQAGKELFETMYGSKPMTDTMRDWFERGGMQSNLQFGELGDIKDLEIIKKFYESDKAGFTSTPAKMWNKWWSTARTATDFREGILRYSTYLDYLEQMQNNNGVPKNFGASDKEEIMALSDIRDRAFWLSNDLLGAYDKISVTGQFLRKHYIPFWSWKEANFKRYVQGFKNAMYDEKAIGALGRQFGAKTPYAIYRVGKLVARATAVWGALQAYNNTRYPEEEKSLPPDIRNRPHIILGRDSSGNVKYFSRLGALGDVLAWVGMDAPVQIFSDYLNGKLTVKEIAQDMGKAPVNVFVGGAAPFHKTIFELAAGRSFYPDVFAPRTIRDRGLYLAQQLGLNDEYKAIAGMPQKKYSERLENLLYYKINPGESAYYQIQDLKRSWAKKNGKEYDGFILTPRSNALYNVKMAVRFGDKEAMQKYMAEYVAMGGSQKDLANSIVRMHPLAGINRADLRGFNASLNAEDRRNLEKAIKFYNENLLGGFRRMR